MNIIDRYIYGLFFRYFFGGMALLVTLFTMIVFFELVGDFTQAQAPLSLMATYFLFRLPEALYYMAPMAVLAAAILALSMMTRQKETMVLMSCGVSAYRITRPVIVGAILVAAGAFLVGEYLLPSAWSGAEDIWRHKVKKYRDVSSLKQNKVWIKSPTGEIWNIGFLDLAKETLHDVTVVRLSPGHEGFVSVIQAEIAQRGEKGEWRFIRGREREISAEGEVTDHAFRDQRYAFALGFDELEHAEKRPEEMNLREISSYIDHIKRTGYEDIRYTVDMYAKITFPLISVVMAVLAIPFGLKGRRTGGALASVTLAVTVGFVFWFFFSIGISLGHSGKLPPLLAAAGAHMLFLFGAAYALLSGYHLREGSAR